MIMGKITANTLKSFLYLFIKRSSEKMSGSISSSSSTRCHRHHTLLQHHHNDNINIEIRGRSSRVGIQGTIQGQHCPCWGSCQEWKVALIDINSIIIIINRITISMIIILVITISMIMIIIDQEDRKHTGQELLLLCDWDSYCSLNGRLLWGSE